MTALVRVGAYRTTFGIPMTSDPLFTGSNKADPRTVRQACQYATEMLRRAGTLTGDLSALDAFFEPPATVVFISADEDQAEVARFTVPEHVMAFGPHKPALVLTDGD